VSLVQEINAAYDALKNARVEVHELEEEILTTKQVAIEENFEELKSARSVEARNQTINVLLKDDADYWQAVEAASKARLEFDLAKDEIERLKLLARLEDQSGNG